MPSCFPGGVAGRFPGSVPAEVGGCDRDGVGVRVEEAIEDLLDLLGMGQRGRSSSFLWY